MINTKIDALTDMQSKPYRSPWKLLVLLLAWAWLLPACDKEDAPALPPQIAFLADEGYIHSDTSLIVGDRVQVGINATASGGNITFFQVSVNNGTKKILLDSGLNSPVISYNLDIIKSASPSEQWTFLVMDRNRNRDSIQIVLHKSDSSHYGKIRIYEDVELGAQENASRGSFFAFDNGIVMDLEMAYQDQAAVSMVYYFGQYDGTLSSPNEAEAPDYFTGPMGLANWTIKNETRYDTTSVSAQAFDQAMNDSLILAAYEPAEGKRKTKYVLPGMVISFKDPAGKIGLISVLEASPGAEGYLKVSIKVQE